MVTHPVVVRGAAGTATDTPPTILRSDDAAFVGAMLADLRGPGLDAVLQGAVTGRNDLALKLHLPVHRSYYLALVDIACDRYGLPRLDPSEIDSVGLVLRRQAEDAFGNPRPGVWEGWQRAGERLQGWMPFAAGDDLRDPDAARRRGLSAGNQAIDTRLAPFLSPVDARSESVSPLFKAPPDICAATQRTLLYGLVPVVSNEQSETPPAGFSYGPAELASHMPAYLRAGGQRSVPRAGQTLGSSAADDPALHDFIGFLRQLAVEFNLFGETDQAHALYAELNVIDLSPDPTMYYGAADFLHNATLVLVARQGATDEDSAPLVMMPPFWPTISAERAARILELVGNSLGSSLRHVRPREGRFDARGRHYQLRVFVRVRRPDGCPPELVWSAPSETFSIAPWWDGAGPPLLIDLPDPFDKKLRASLKPNVAFSVPPSLFGVMQASSLEDIPNGIQKGSIGVGLMWICSFSLPLITICAFIVLNLFLSLFDIVFHWMLLIKICLPLPVPQREE
jgi:hypothetical protein